MLTGKRALTVLAIAVCLVMGRSVSAKVIYADRELKADITDGTYSIKDRAPGGHDGNACRTVQGAINAMSPGDHIVVRGGVYAEGSIKIPLEKNGTGWEEGKYNKLCSYPGEWAVLDGENRCTMYGAVLGFAEYDATDRFDLKYWWFERLEIKNGTDADRANASAFHALGGPFKFRYLYIHDNVNDGRNNPGGIKVRHMQDSLIEYCCFINNGVEDHRGQTENNGHIIHFSDYNWNETARKGYSGDGRNHPCGMRNEIRYNLFLDAGVGYKYKGSQLLSPRNVPGEKPWDDTYIRSGDRIHHNVFREMRGYAVGPHQDFSQVHHNVMDSCGSGIMFAYEPTFPIYKAVSYNNTILNATTIGLVRFPASKSYYAQAPGEKMHFGWDYNNILSGCRDSEGSSKMHSLNVVPISASGVRFEVTQYFGSNNYFHNPPTERIIRMQDKSYTAAEYEAQTLTAGPRVVYYDGPGTTRNPFKGADGADRYKEKADFALKDGKTLATGGIGGGHPYLPGVKIPSYVGAANPLKDSGAKWDPEHPEPDDAGWVDYVLGLEARFKVRAETP